MKVLSLKHHSSSLRVAIKPQKFSEKGPVSQKPLKAFPGISSVNVCVCVFWGGRGVFIYLRAGVVGGGLGEAETGGVGVQWEGETHEDIDKLSAGEGPGGCEIGRMDPSLCR